VALVNTVMTVRVASVFFRVTSTSVFCSVYWRCHF